ncbi:hypothetical protein [Flavobacterium sp. N1719]|uniref:hypothetical protein n=1 Tax=Flavobacterium sp. N1719 TaxID=2885633 RepID=UPI002223601B|nr:hypothetical protein [Flavobacterium sp. N1719]
MKNIKEKEKFYQIKIPIYISDSKIDENHDVPFEELVLSQDLLVQNLISKIEQHKEKNVVLTTGKRNKTTTRNIDEVKYEKVNFGNDLALLLKITSFSSNLFDGFIEKDTRIKLDKNDKIGSEHYYAIIYPHIFGIEKREYKWIVFVYEDPNKENSEIVSSVKIVLKNVLNIVSVNIKLPDFISRVKNLKDSVELSMKFITVNFEDNEVDYNINGYEVQTKLTKINESSYKGVPISKINEIVEDKSFVSKFHRRILKIVSGKHELKLEQEYSDEADSKFKETAEELFNYTSEVSSIDVETEEIYKTEYILKKIQPVMENYLNSFPND